MKLAAPRPDGNMMDGCRFDAIILGDVFDHTGLVIGELVAPLPDATPVEPVVGVAMLFVPDSEGRCLLDVLLERFGTILNDEGVEVVGAGIELTQDRR